MLETKYYILNDFTVMKAMGSEHFYLRQDNQWLPCDYDDVKDKILVCEGSEISEESVNTKSVKKSHRANMVEVFHDTMDWLKSDPDLQVAVSKSQANTRLYSLGHYPRFDKRKVSDMTITVTKEKSYQLAKRVKQVYPERKVAVLNFANAFHPGGGVKNGSPAQEESLCRTSTLYPVISKGENSRCFYELHKAVERNKHHATDAMLYSKDIVICKTDDDVPQRLGKEEWTTVDVITAAAPDLRNCWMSDEELYGCHFKRAIHILTVAAANDVDFLVLGAFGCGAFQNNPHVVAAAYKDALTVFPEVFKSVEFAVYCPPGKSNNYDVFKEVLVGRETHCV